MVVDGVLSSLSEMGRGREEVKLRGGKFNGDPRENAEKRRFAGQKKF